MDKISFAAYVAWMSDRAKTERCMRQSVIDLKIEAKQMILGRVQWEEMSDEQ